MDRSRRERLARAILYVAPMSFFCWSILHDGTPAVRHDWIWPLDSAGLLQRIGDLSAGWFSEGFGHPNAYPMTYPVMWALMPIAVIFGSRTALLALLATIAFAAVATAEAITARYRLGKPAWAALTLFLLFNPWTYNKVVAGHLTQTLAYVGLALVFVEFTKDRPSSLHSSFAFVIVSLQLQLFVIAVSLMLLRSRQLTVRKALFVAFVVSLPTSIGLVLDRQWLLSLPFAIPWEDQQSVAIHDGVALGGYFVGYADRAFAGFPSYAVLGFALLAFMAPFVLRRRLEGMLAALAALVLVFISGTTWWLAVFWRWSILHLTAIGVFREMYDLIAVVAVVYAVLGAATMARFAPLRWPALACAAVIALSWLRYPPSAYWVAAETLPAPGDALARAARYALMPPYQPLSFHNRGSGADPLYAGRAPNQSPANTLLPEYPANRALTDYWLRGDSTALQRLGVSVIECRPGFSQAAQSFFYRSNDTRRRCPSAETRLSAVAPIVAIEQTFRYCSLCSAAGNGNIFFGDATPAKFRTLDVPREFIEPRLGWVDARLVFANEPALIQGLGGAYTTQRQRPVTIPPGRYALVNVRGSLVDTQGDIIAHDTYGYRWAPLRERSVALRCYGACLVVGVGSPPRVPLEAVAAQAESIPYRSPIPWFIVMSAVTQPGLLRVLNAYDPGWTAFALADSKLLRHVRVDVAFNGWFVRTSDLGSVWLFHVPSVLQAAAEIVGAVVAWRIVVLRVQDALGATRSE